MKKQNDRKLEQLKKRLDMYYAAEEAVLMAQSYSIGSRNLTRADLSEIRTMIEKLEAKVTVLEMGGTSKRKVARIIPKG